MLRSLKKIFTPLSLAGLLAGAIGGYLYYYFIGCRSGSCPIWSSPWISTLWGAVAGYLLGDLPRGKKQNDRPPGDEDTSVPGGGRQEN